MKRAVIQRPEMLEATLRIGTETIELADYAATGLLIVTVGQRGKGKTNAGLVIAEQLSEQGWVSVLVDPEGELESLYGDAVADADDLRERLTKRDKPIVVVSAKDAGEFIPYGRTILEVAEDRRRPLFLMIDETQLLSATRRRKNNLGEASDILNEFAERGRKRALDVFVTAHRFQGSLHRSLFVNKNVTLVGCIEDPAAWSSLAPQFRTTHIDFNDIAALGTGEFFCFSRRGMERVRMQMSEALKRVAPKARAVKPILPTNFRQWDRALREITTDRLEELSDPVVRLLGAVAGLSARQMISGSKALQDELDSRPVG